MADIVRRNNMRETFMGLYRIGKVLKVLSWVMLAISAIVALAVIQSFPAFISAIILGIIVFCLFFTLSELVSLALTIEIHLEKIANK